MSPRCNSESERRELLPRIPAAGCRATQSKNPCVYLGGWFTPAARAAVTHAWQSGRETRCLLPGSMATEICPILPWCRLSGAKRVVCVPEAFPGNSLCSAYEEISRRLAILAGQSRLFWGNENRAYGRSTTKSCGCGAAAGTCKLCGVQHADASRETSRRMAGMAANRRSTSRSTAAVPSSAGIRSR